MTNRIPHPAAAAAPTRKPIDLLLRALCLAGAWVVSSCSGSAFSAAADDAGLKAAPIAEKTLHP